MAVENPHFQRYCLVGALATGVHYLVLVALCEGAGMAPGLAAAIGASCGALVAYAANRRFTFRSDSPHRQALPRFALVAAFGVVASAAVVWSGTEMLRLDYLVAQAMATGLVLAAGFTLNRRWAFA